MDTENWPGALACEFAPYEELIAEETVRRFVKGGRSRRALLRGAGESAGGFDGSARSGDLVQLLEALLRCGPAALAVLEHPGVTGASDADGALIELIELRRTRETESGEPTGAQGTIAVSPQVLQAVDEALEQLAGQLASRQGQDAAWDAACRLLRLLARNPESAAVFVRGLDPSLRRRSAARWQLAWPRSLRLAVHGADPGGVYVYDEDPGDPDGPMVQVRERLLRAPALDRDQVRRAVRHPWAGDLIRLVDEAGRARIPAFQVEAGVPVPVVVQINRLLGAEEDPWGVADWWLRRNTRLGAAPATLVGQVPDAVLLGCAEAVLG